MIVDSQKRFQGFVNKFRLLNSSFLGFKFQVFKDLSSKIQLSSFKFDLEVFLVLVLGEGAIWMYVAI